MGGLLIDLDGVVYQGDSAVAGAADAIGWLESRRVPFLFVTNTTSRSRQALVSKLAAMGVDVIADRIRTPPSRPPSFGLATTRTRPG
jgi:ribonucleotide monophosphatase NagD (HAD superfamily)